MCDTTWKKIKMPECKLNREYEEIVRSTQFFGIISLKMMFKTAVINQFNMTDIRAGLYLKV